MSGDFRGRTAPLSSQWVKIAALEISMRTPLFIAFFIGLTGFTHAAPLMLHRGVGVHEWLNWSPLAKDGTYAWPPYRGVADWLGGYRPASDWPAGDEFVRIRKMGFDFVRLSVDPGPLLASEGEKRQQAIDVLKSDVAQITAAGLKVVFNLHPVSQVPAYGPDLVNAGAESQGIASYREVSADVARMLVTIGTEKVAIEPFNEPAYYPCDTGGRGEWQQIMSTTVEAIRAVSRELTIVATGACGGDITGLVDLDPSFDDANVLYSFHMYDPHSFTHQRLDDPKMFGSGLPWPPSAGTPEQVVARLQAWMDAAKIDAAAQAANLDAVRPYADAYFRENWDEAALRKRFDEAVQWAQANDIPTKRLFMGEFGAILMSKDGRTGAPDGDRLRYITDVRKEAETLGFPWSVWEYSNPFGMTVIVPEGPAEPDRGLLDALGLPAG
jgi:endoglucanase